MSVEDLISGRRRESGRREIQNVLIALARKSGTRNHRDQAEPVRSDQREGKPFPMTLNQEEFWLLHRLQPGCNALNLAMAFRLTGPLDVGALENAFHSVISRHESLRTQFGSLDGQPTQTVRPIAQFELPIRLLGSEPEGVVSDEILRFLEHRTFEMFHFEDGPPVRVLLLKLNDTEHLLWWCMHHIMIDALGLGVFIRELGEFYRFHAFAEKPEVGDHVLQCIDYAKTQRALYQAVRQDCLGYWDRQLAGYNPKVTLPTDFPRPILQTFSGASIDIGISEVVQNRLEHLGKRNGASLFMVYLAAFYVMIHSFTQETDIVVGSPISQRKSGDVEGVISDFSNMLLYRLRLDGTEYLGDVLTKVRTLALEAYQNSDMPSQELLAGVDATTNPGYSPLFQMMFVFQQSHPNNSQQWLKGVRTTQLQLRRDASQFDSSIFLFYGAENGTSGRFDYNPDLYTRRSATGFVERFQSVLLLMAMNPETRISEWNK